MNISKIKNIYLTSLCDRLIFDIKIDILKIKNPWVLSDFYNIVQDGIFRHNKIFYKKTSSATARRMFSRGASGANMIVENKKVLTFKEYLVDRSDN